MAASAVTPKEFDSFSSRLNQGNIINGVDVSEGHSVDGPNIGQWKEESTNKEEDQKVRQMTQESSLSPCETASLDKSKTEESKRTYDKEIVNKVYEVDARKCASNISAQCKKEKVPSSHVTGKDATRSQSVFIPSHISGDERIENPNVYWLNTEFDRLVSDKKRIVKTTIEMRKELKEIGLGDASGQIIAKPKSLADIMREYGLQPSMSTTLSCTSPMVSVKSAWMPRHKYGIMNMSQNNETQLCSKSEADDVRANGSSVDGDFVGCSRHPVSNSNFTSVTNSRDHANVYSENKHVSRKPSFSHYEFKNSASASNHDMLLSAKSSSEMKRSDDRPLNPSTFFQRERERLQRIDSVISRTPKSSYTAIPRVNTWERTENTFAALRASAPNHRPSYANVEHQSSRYGGYGEEEKDWGNTSPSRTFLQRPSSMTGASRQYSPLSNVSNLQNHDNPVFRDSGNTSFSFSKSPLTRHVPSRSKQQTTHVPKPSRAQSIPNKTHAKQAPAPERNTNKSSSKSVSDNSKWYKAPKTKLRHSKSSASAATSTKTKSLGDVNKEDFIAKLMENYTGNRTEYDNGSYAGLRKDFYDEWQQSECNQSGPVQVPSTSLCESNVSRDEVKIRNGKYKPYQQNVSSETNMYNKIKGDCYNFKATRANVPTAWPGSFDLKKYLLDDDSCFSSKSTQESVSNADGRRVPYRSSSRQSSIPADYGHTGQYSERMNGQKISSRLKMKNDSSQLGNDIDEPTSIGTDVSLNTSDDPSLKSSREEGKTKVVKRKKSSTKKFSSKQK